MTIWHDINKKQPKDGQKVLIYDGEDIECDIYDGQRDDGSHYFISFEETVTHWAQLPKFCLHYVYKPEFYDRPMAISNTPSKECREYHEGKS